MPERDSGQPSDTVSPKTAVILIHGMGEQRPMEKIYEFVEAVWSSDSSLVEPHHGQVYSKPSALNSILDLRRVTTRYWSGDNPRRIDFFEYYWAHLMVGNTVRSTVSWIMSLFLRRPSSVPSGLRSVWLAGSLLLAAAAALLVLAGLPEWITKNFLAREWIVLLGAVSALASFAAARWLAPVAGDAARYFSPLPDNVTARENIIRGGVELVENLTRSGSYDRIIVVGHSLGSAIGLDVLNSAYGRISANQWSDTFANNPQAQDTLKDLDRQAGLALAEPSPADEQSASKNFDLGSYRAAQRRLAKALAVGWEKGNSPWLVSDFVTLGSPLSKANVLIARDEAGLELRIKKRELPTCPPMLEAKRPPRFSFRRHGATSVPHHGAVFGSTAWTNIYFPSRLIVFGDIVSGAVAPLFGKGVRDVRIPFIGFRFRHLDYWRLEPGHVPVWITALRHALNLRERADSDLWQDGLPTSSLMPAEATQQTISSAAKD